MKNDLACAAAAMYETLLAIFVGNMHVGFGKPR